MAKNGRMCSVSGCENHAERRGWCSSHYRRWIRHGDPTAGGAYRQKRGSECYAGGCDRPVFGRGLCQMHYTRMRNHGGLNVRHRPANGEALKFIWEVALKYSGDDCLIWPFNRQRNGYASAVVNDKTQRVHRVLCTEIFGPPPTDVHEVAHSCGNGCGGCVNPRHLRWATREENNQEKLLHGGTTRGERHPNAKLSERDIKEIRSLKERFAQKEIAEMFGVSRSLISLILSGSKWGWLQ